MSSGTYIRTLAYDIGQALGTGGFLRKLKRTEIGKIKLKKAYKIKKVKAGNWQKFLLK